MKRPSLQHVLIISGLSALTLLCVWLGLLLHQNAGIDKKLKADYFAVNQIKYGLLSGNNWSWQVNRILAEKIDSFTLENKNRQLLVKEVNEILNRMLDEANKVLHQERDKLKDKIRFALINSVFNVEDFRQEVPRFSNAIVDQLNKSKNKEKIKDMLKQKISGILDAADQDSLKEKRHILNKYGVEYVADFNLLVNRRIEEIREEQHHFGYFITAILVIILLIWLYIIRLKEIYAVSFLISVLASFIAMFIGVSLPMIEIDARISELNLELLSSHIVFYDQVIFYQAKSILDVIRILITHGRADTVFVGILILTFSVLFPVTKLICTTIYLFMRKKSKGFVRYMAFNSGKWSMADVMVIAIFMAYVGFQSILDNQLEDITVHNDTINVVTTNKTNLQTGFMVFVAFCLFNLMLAEILKRITRQEKKPGES